MAIDLHCHTKLSDGSLGLEELIIAAKRRGLHTIAVTDHDTVAGATRAVLLGKRYGVDVIHGVEFSATDPVRGGKVHILGYRCQFPDRLEGLCHATLASRRKAATAMVQRVLRYYPITPEFITRRAAGSTCIYKQHIMHALMDIGYADGIYGEVYRKLFSPEGGCAYVAMEYPAAQEVIRRIHDAGGLAVLAHPAAHHSTDYRGEEVLEELTASGELDGVEIWHPRHSDEATARLAAFAEEHHLLMTGGSDFHGFYDSEIHPMGSVTVADEIAAALCAAKR